MIKNAVVELGKTPAIQGGVSDAYVEGEATKEQQPVKSMVKLASEIELPEVEEKK